MLLKFITGASWLWGGLCVFTIAYNLRPPIEQKHVELALRDFIFAIPAWGWLIAWYWL